MDLRQFCGAGGVLSADIAVPEHEREVSFYSRVLGTGDRPLWREDLMNNQGTPVIGLGARSAEYADLPLQWMPHIQVPDVAASVATALSLGGQELMHGKDDEGNSQWAVLLDPIGAAFGLIPVVSAEEIPSSDSGSVPVGHIAGLQLAVADAAASRDFYRQVVGWTGRDIAVKDERGDYTDYTMLDADGNPVAGICHARGVRQDVPPVWMICLPVADFAESLRRVREGGGRVLMEVPAAQGSDAHAVIEDPVGVALVLVPG